MGECFLVQAHPGSPKQRAIKRARVCVCSNGNSPARVSDLVADFEVKEGEQKSCVKIGNR